MCSFLFIFLFLSSFPPTVKPLSCTGMENIQAINASMPVQCQAVPKVETVGGGYSSPTIATSGI